MGMPSTSGDVGEELDLRKLIVDAAIEIALAEHQIPSPESVAEKAGLSPETITHIFPTLDDLAAEIRNLTIGSFSGLDEAMPSPGSLLEMLDELVELRAELYEASASLRQLGDSAERFLPSISQAKAVQDGLYRGKLASLLNDYLEDQKSDLLAQVEFITSWESWRHLRVVQRLSVDQAKDMIRSVLHAVASSV